MLRIVAATIAVIAVIAAFTGVMYLRYSDDSIPRVVVAARDIPSGARIQSDMVTIRNVPAAQTAPNAYRDTAEVIGKVAAYDMASGEQIVHAKVLSMPVWGTGKSDVVPPGQQVGPLKQSIGVGFGN